MECVRCLRFSGAHHQRHHHRRKARSGSRGSSADGSGGVQRCWYSREGTHCACRRPRPTRPHRRPQRHSSPNSGRFVHSVPPLIRIFTVCRDIELNPVPAASLIILYSTVALYAALLVAGWDRIPDPMPTHWGISGAPDAFTSKTPGAVFGMLAIGAVPLGLLTPLVLYATHSQAEHGDDHARATANEMMPLIA
ncbi:DUF1648 domain-containing protein [Corynebacterium sanguinis]|uniref:DUF1648 domain-containing protein n=1 Tax=Corynebacterium sanguinis TaxID=2594913 RepID=A0A6C1TYC2_9CORY|nr:DUF1648 domain-containing protein [Corynebacterium sanguinis]TVS28969.1 DUF1648 domain-containing protein [Corynebacterium sanguinis]